LKKISPIKNETKRRKEPIENSSNIINDASPYSTFQILNEPWKEKVLEESEGNALMIKGFKKNYNETGIINTNNSKNNNQKKKGINSSSNKFSDNIFANGLNESINLNSKNISNIFKNSIFNDTVKGSEMPDGEHDDSPEVVKGTSSHLSGLHLLLGEKILTVVLCGKKEVELFCKTSASQRR
jgi:hypothetical protein